MREFISPIKKYLSDFYNYKQLCGYKYETSYDVLIEFDRYYNNLKIKKIKMTRDIIEPFLYLKEGERIGNQMAKASVIRQFIKYLLNNEIIDKAYIIPSISKKGEASFVPYIYSKENLASIIKFLENYESTNIKPFTLETVIIIFKVLMSTGMRISEVTNLKFKNINLDENLFIITEAKNNNQRIVPFSNTLKKNIIEYLKETKINFDDNDYIFSITSDKKLSTKKCEFYLRKAIRELNIKSDRTHNPTIHGFRHTYATLALAQLQKSEENINLSLSYLSSYLGHKSINETQKYLWLTPELFEETKNKMNDYSSFISKIYQGEKYDEE